MEDEWKMNGMVVSYYPATRLPPVIIHFTGISHYTLWGSSIFGNRYGFTSGKSAVRSLREIRIARTNILYKQHMLQVENVFVHNEQQFLSKV